MKNERWVLGLLGWVVIGCLACGSPPIPRVVVKGTSFVVMLGGEEGAGEGESTYQRLDIGFGGTWRWNSGGGTDVQRGEVQFYLDDANDPLNLLETDLVTRVFPDPSSDVGTINGVWVSGGNVGMAQIQALVFVPCTVDADPEVARKLKARKVTRDTAGDLAPFQPNESLVYEQDIIIAENPNGCSGDDDRNEPILALQGSPTLNYFSDPALFDWVYPDPKLLIALPDSVPFDPAGLPAAAHLEIIIPDDISVKNVFEEQDYGRRSLVIWKINGNGNLEIDFVTSAPGPFVDTLAVAFTPDPTPDAYERIEPEEIGNEFEITSETYWDPSGSVIQGAAAAFVAIR